MALTTQFSRICKFIEAWIHWKRSDYIFEHHDSNTTITMFFNEEIFLRLAQRYKELFIPLSGPVIPEIPYDIDSTAIESDTEKIAANYMNSTFVKYFKSIQEDGPDAQKALDILEESLKNFASLSQEDQEYDEFIIGKIQICRFFIEDGKIFKDYIKEYKIRKKNNEMHKFASLIGIDEDMLKELKMYRPTASSINEFGRFVNLICKLNQNIAKVYFDKIEGIQLVKIKAENLIRDYMVQGGFDI